MRDKPDFSPVLRRLQAEALRILIWGPGTGSEADYNKRKKIQDVIQKQFTAAEVYFSEELMGQVPNAEHLTLPQQEAWHLAWCDICIVLNTSQSTASEIDGFRNSNLAYKLFILTPQPPDSDHARSYTGRTRERLSQVFYTNDEWESCELTKHALIHARKVALGKMIGLQLI